MGNFTVTNLGADQSGLNNVVSVSATYTDPVTELETVMQTVYLLIPQAMGVVDPTTWFGLVGGNAMAGPDVLDPNQFSYAPSLVPNSVRWFTSYNAAFLANSNPQLIDPLRAGVTPPVGPQTTQNSAVIPNANPTP
jgi:hypothetical protein